MSTTKRTVKNGWGKKTTHQPIRRLSKNKKIRRVYSTQTNGLRALYKALRLAHQLRYGRAKSFAFYKRRTRQYKAMIKAKYPKGLPMYSRPAPWRCMVETSDLVLLTGCNIRTAQRKLKKIREDLGKGRLGLITVMEFCEKELLPQEFVQDVLNGIPWAEALKRNKSLLKGYRQKKEKDDEEDEDE